MTRYRSRSPANACQAALLIAANKVGVAGGNWDHGVLKLTSPIGGWWAHAHISVASIEEGGSELRLWVQPRLWLRALIQGVVGGLCAIAIWLFTGYPMSNNAALVITGGALLFALYMLTVGRRCSRMLEAMFAQVDGRVDGLQQVTPFAVQIRWYEFALMGLWASTVLVYVVVQLGVVAGLFSAALVAVATFGLPMVNRSQSSYRISQYLLEINLVLACAVFVAAIAVMSSQGLVYSLIANFEGDRASIDLSYVFHHMLADEWHRPEHLGFSARDYAAVLAEHMHENAKAMEMTRIGLIASAVFGGIGFWSLRRSVVLGRSLVQVRVPVSPDAPMPATDEDIAWYIRAAMVGGCVTAGVYRWAYALLALDLTLALWLGKSVLIAPLDWITHFFLAMLSANGSSLWPIAGYFTLQLIALPGLLLLCETAFRCIRFMWRDLRAPGRCSRAAWHHPSVDRLQQMLKARGIHEIINVIADPSLRQVAAARVSLLTRRRMIVVNPEACREMEEEQLDAMLLHECRHLLGHSQRLALLELGSLLLLAPHNSLQVLYDFYRAELEADRYAAELMGDPAPSIGALVRAKTATQYRGKESSAFPTLRVRGGRFIRSTLSWCSPVFLRETVWTAAYPSDQERIRRLMALNHRNDT